MKKIVTVVGVVVLGGVLLASAGCASLSLFSSTETHYHGTKEIEERLDRLEERVGALDRAARTTAENAE